MKIVKFESFPVSVGYSHAELSARVRRGGVSDVIVKLTTDNGLVGWGESCSGADTRSIEAALQSMAPFVLNQDPWNSEAIAHEVFRTGLWEYRAMTGNFAFAGIDMALWDLCGKECGQPLYRMFGGALSEEADYFYYMEWGKPEAIAAQGADGRRRGYRAYYIKAGVDEKREEEMLEALRDAIGPEGLIRIDVNQAWSLPQAARLLRRWHERFDLDFVEAAVPIDPVENMLDLRRRVSVALCVNEGLWREADAYRVIKSRCGDYLCFSPYWVGSLARFHTLNWIGHMEGWQLCKHTHGELGLTAAACHHLVIAAPNAGLGHQQTAQMMGDDILTERLPIADGPRWGRIEKPGIGVEIDEDKLRRYDADYREFGEFPTYGGKAEAAR
jgi:L-Ala-D/L-Glu epimerase